MAKPSLRVPNNLLILSQGHNAMRARASFYSRKTLFMIFSIVVVALVVLNLTNWVISQRPSSTSPNKDPFVGLSEREQSILKAENYLLDYITQTMPPQRLILDYLQRKYDLNPAIGVSGPPIDLYENPASYPEEIHFLARIVYPDKLVKQQPKGVISDPSIMSIYAANCDHLALPGNYWQIVQKNVSEGGYAMAHATIALAFMRDNGCSIPQEAAEIRATARDGLVELAGDPATVSDLRYETVAFLQLDGRYDLVEPDWIDRIISEQNADGSWGLSLADKKPNDHATVLALWALLEYNYPNKPHEPLIRRPSSQM